VFDGGGRLLSEYRSGGAEDFFRAVACDGAGLVCGGSSSDRRFLGRSRIPNAFLMRFDLQGRPLDSLRIASDGVTLLSALALTDSTIVCTGVADGDPHGICTARMCWH
jgi:hypothetical protein